MLPEEAALWEMMETRAREVLGAYSFSEIIVPIMEKTDLFARSIGETTDIVEKEMYTFADRDGTSVTLRPEGTASVIRAYLENGLYHKESVSKLYYFGPMLRRERPQKGRYRQFYQIGAEILGRSDPLIDAELLLMLRDLFAALHLDVTMQLNSLGCSLCRPHYRESLQIFGEERRDALCENCNRRLERNPLRLLDCKEEKCQHTTADAPVILDYICQDCREHFARVQTYLQQEAVEFELNRRMVRGLDYYCRTSFEVLAQGLGSQNAVCGGGRYDGLVEQLGGPAVPGIGFAIGVERLAMVLQAQKPYVPPHPYLLIAPLGEQAEAMALSVAGRLRRSGCRVELESGKKGLKSQMRRADRLGVRYVLILGENELAAVKGTLRDMQEKRDYPTAVDLGLAPQDMLHLIQNLSG